MDELKTALELAQGLGSTINTWKSLMQDAIQALGGKRPTASEPKQIDSGEMRQIDANEIRRIEAEIRIQIEKSELKLEKIKWAIEQADNVLKRMREFDQTAQRYEPYSTIGHGLVYRLKRNYQKEEPDHYLCPNCFTDRRKSVLQPSMDFKFCCSRCGMEGTL